MKDELVMTLMRLGSFNAELAVCFGVSETTVRKVINTWVRFLAKELKCLIHIKMLLCTIYQGSTRM